MLKFLLRLKNVSCLDRLPMEVSKVPAVVHCVQVLAVVARYQMCSARLCYITPKSKSLFDPYIDLVLCENGIRPLTGSSNYIKPFNSEPEGLRRPKYPKIVYAKW